MTIAIILSLWLSVSAHGAGLLEKYSPSQARLASCKLAALSEAGEPAAVTRLWKNCLEEAEAQNQQDILPTIRGHLVLAGARTEALDRGDLSREESLEMMLQAAGAARDVHYDLETLADVFRRYLATERGRNRMGPYRDVSVRWFPSLAVNYKDKAEQVMRRHIEDAGFRYAPHGSDAGARAAVRLTAMARPSFGRDQGGGPSLVTAEWEIAVESVTVNKGANREEIQGFLCARQASGPNEADASSDALNLASKDLAAALLHRVIMVAFRDYVQPGELRGP